MNFNNDEEAFGFFTRLLERLHQADFTNHDSKIEFVYVAPGAQNIHTQNVYHNAKQDSVDSLILSGAPPKLPEQLSTPEAMTLWQQVLAAGYVDANYLPLISRTQAAILAYEMAKRLDIKDKWKLFEAFWCRRNMYRDYYDALNQSQSIKFRDKLKSVLR